MKKPLNLISWFRKKNQDMHKKKIKKPSNLIKKLRNKNWNIFK